MAAVIPSSLTPPLRATQELDVPFYFTPSRIASFFHCTSPPLDDVA